MFSGTNGPVAPTLDNRPTADAAAPVPIAIKSNWAAAISTTLPALACYFCSSDGNPALVVAFISALVSVFASSNVTTASFFSYRTSTLETPSTLFSAFLTVMGQVGHVIPGTFRVTVFDAAQPQAVSKVRLKTRVQNCRFFKANPFLLMTSIEKSRNVRVSNCHGH